MMHRIVALLLVLLSPAVVSAAPGQGLEACTGLASPFDTLARMTLDTAISNPPQVQLCHRAANARQHYAIGRTRKVVDELEKYIAEVTQSTPRHVDGAYAQALVAEAQRLISIISGDVSLTGTVSGGVFDFSTNQPVGNASVSLSFLGADQAYRTQTDANGLFALEELPLSGAFVADAVDASGASGSAQGTLSPTESEASVLVLVDSPGPGLIHGHVTDPEGGDAPGILVTALYPETGREYSTTAGPDGYYRLEGLRADGTVILIALENASGASASYSSVVTPYSPTAIVDLTLVYPSIVNADLMNAGFTDGLTGWTYSGPVHIVDRGLVFGAQN